MIEEWKPVVGFENIYEVSNLGRVKSLTRKKPYRDGFRRVLGKILTPNILRSGYAQVTLQKDRARTLMLVHRLVATAFIDNPAKLPQVNHIDGNKLNNRYNNLEWCTAKENMVHSVDFGIRTDTKPVDMFTKSGEFVRSFNGVREAERKTGIWRTNIRKCCKKINKTAGGYVWKYRRKDA